MDFRRAIRAVLRGWTPLGALASLIAISSPASATPWDGSYFPNVPLITHEGETVRFFDDLLRDKIVAINFIYTTCPDSCPLETAQLLKVQRLLGERLGTDIFFYSISIDPEVDTPEVLSEYRERFGARWTFLTGREADITTIRRKLGLYVEEIQDESNNDHNLNMIIGNQSTGRWMKRSPMENPYVLADQLGNWLDGWRSPQRGDDYANAPKLRSIPNGEQLFRTRCATCHTVTGNELPDALGPDLLGVSESRDPTWLLNWLRAPDRMLADEDPIAMELYARYNDLPMPNMRLNRQEAEDLIEYISRETELVRGQARTAPGLVGEEAAPNGEVVAIKNAWVRETDPKASVNAGYMTLSNIGASEVTLVAIECEVFDSVALHEMTTIDGMMKMRELERLVIPKAGLAQLAPGGKHLMMRKPRKHLQAGETVEVTLVFESGERQLLSMLVAAK